MDDRRITRDDSADWRPRVGSRPDDRRRGWRDWSPRSLVGLSDGRPTDRADVIPYERLRSPDDESLPV